MSKPKKEKYKNILLLGETGVGKSTFINSIANYYQYREFNNAARKGAIILAPTLISVTAENNKIISIPLSSDGDEMQKIGDAGTRDVKTYIFPINGEKLRLIDTPGMGDPRGVEQDNINFDKILKYLLSLEELHAICFLIKPTTTRNNALFEYCLKQILSRFQTSASKNIIFVFTNTRGTNYGPGDTYSCLQKIIKDIKDQPPHVDIPFNKNNTFALDNEAFKIVAAMERYVRFQKRVIENAAESWDVSTKQFYRLISYVDTLMPHQIYNTIQVNQARKLIVQLSQPLIDVCLLIDDNIHIWQKHKHDLNEQKQTLEELKTKLYIPYNSLKVTHLKHAITVCGSQKCAEVVKVGNSQKWNYPQICHAPCYLDSIVQETRGIKELIKCEAMKGKFFCSKCTCHYSKHMHIYYTTKVVRLTTLNKSVDAEISNRQIVEREKQRLLEFLSVQIAEAKSECSQIISSVAALTYFLQSSTISPYTDFFIEHITRLIEREKSFNNNSDLEIIKNLEALLEEYKQNKTKFEKRPEPVSVNDTTEIVTKLYQMKQNGEKIKELFDNQQAARSWELDENDKNINSNEIEVKPSNFSNCSAGNDKFEPHHERSGLSEEKYKESRSNISTDNSSNDQSDPKKYNKCTQLCPKCCKSYGKITNNDQHLMSSQGKQVQNQHKESTENTSKNGTSSHSSNTYKQNQQPNMQKDDDMDVDPPYEYREHCNKPSNYNHNEPSPSSSQRHNSSHSQFNLQNQTHKDLQNQDHTASVGSKWSKTSPHIPLQKPHYRALQDEIHNAPFQDQDHTSSTGVQLSKMQQPGSSQDRSYDVVQNQTNNPLQNPYRKSSIGTQTSEIPPEAPFRNPSYNQNSEQRSSVAIQTSEIHNMTHNMPFQSKNKAFSADTHRSARQPQVSSQNTGYNMPQNQTHQSPQNQGHPSSGTVQWPEKSLERLPQNQNYDVPHSQIYQPIQNQNQVSSGGTQRFDKPPQGSPHHKVFHDQTSMPVYSQVQGSSSGQWPQKQIREPPQDAGYNMSPNQTYNPIQNQARGSQFSQQQPSQNRHYLVSQNQEFASSTGVEWSQGPQGPTQKPPPQNQGAQSHPPLQRQPQHSSYNVQQNPNYHPHHSQGNMSSADGQYFQKPSQRPSQSPSQNRAPY